MNCNEIQEHLFPFADGELEPGLEAQVREALASGQCPEAQAELDELRTLSALAREGFEAPVEDVDFSGFYEAVAARLDAGRERAPESQQEIQGVGVQREADGDDVLTRIAAWFGELFRFERPLTAFATAGAAIAVVLGLWAVGSEPGPSVQPTAPSVAKVEGPASPAAPARARRRGREGESFAGRNAARVESWETVAGRVIIENNDDDPDKPVVVWHVDDTEALEQGL